MPEAQESPFKRASATKRARRSEEAAAKSDGGKRVARSGAGRQKGDVLTGLYMIEDKFTDAESYTLTRKALDKANVQAVGEHRHFQFRITMPGYKLRVMLESDYLAMQAVAANVTDSN